MRNMDFRFRGNDVFIGALALRAKLHFQLSKTKKGTDPAISTFFLFAQKAKPLLLDLFLGRDRRGAGYRLRDGAWLLLHLDDAGRERAHEEDVAAAVARERDDRLQRAFRGDAAAMEFAEFEDRVVHLPITRSTDRARLTKNIL